MLVTERPRFRRGNEEEEKRRRELRLSHYSENLSQRLLTNNGKETLSPKLPDGVVSAFQIGSLKDRDVYWKDAAPAKKFGEQMVTWLGDKDKPGISQWLSEQQDPEAGILLQEVGLKAASPEQTAKDMQKPQVVSLLAEINKDLKAAGRPELKDLTEADSRALIFYTQYLNPTNARGQEVRSLIETLVDKASGLSHGNREETQQRLEAIAPLLRVMGEDAQHALGALMVAHSDARDANDRIQQVDPHAVLKDEESFAWEFIRKNRLAKKPEQLKAGEQQSVVETFTNLEPEAEAEGNPYFITGDLPANIASQLTPEQLRGWELRKSMWTLVGGKLPLNREVFAPAYVLEKDGRFHNGELLTNNDSGLFALAAASAPTPEKQAALYKTLGEVVVRSHIEDPRLLGEFLQGQTEESQRQFLHNEMQRFEPLIDAKDTALSQWLDKSLVEKFHVNQITTPEQKAYFDQLFAQATSELGTYRATVLTDIAQFPNRLLVAADAQVPEGTLDPVPYVINLPETLKVWPERVVALQEALHREPLTLTPEQIRQIEFLAHSVDVVKVMEFLQGQASVAPEGAQPTRRDVVPAPFVESATLLENPAPVAQEVPTIEQPALEATPAAPAETAPTDRMEAEAPIAAPEMQKDALEGMFAKLTTSPKEGNNFYTETPDAIRPVRRLVDEWKTYLLRVPVGEQKTPPNLGTYILQENKQTGEIDVKGMDYRKPFLQNLLQPSTRANEAQDFMWDENRKWYDANHKNDNYEMNATLFAFAADAAATPADQAKIFSTMAQQILLFYDANADLTDTARSYFTHVNRYGLKWPPMDVDSLVGTQMRLRARARQIREDLRQDRVTPQDMVDISLLALPFDLRKLARDMQQATQQPAPETPEAPTPTE